MEVVVCSEIFGAPKPDIGIFHHAVNQLGGQPHEYVYIGDNYDGDIIGAKKAGLAAIFFNIAHYDYSNEPIQPDYTITQLLELKDIL